jgi:hypothetical protein
MTIPAEIPKEAVERYDPGWIRTRQWRRVMVISRLW